MADAAKILLTEGDAPGTPASGQVALYPKADKKLYIKDSTGTESPVSPTVLLKTTIDDGDVTHAPDGNAVYDALALKAPLNSPSFTTPTSDMIKFGTTPTVGDFVEGKLYYDNLWKTLSLEAGRDVTLQIGQEEWRRVYNTGAAILNGQSVYSTGVYSGALPHVITVGLAGSATSAESFVLGIATQDIDTNTYGFITVRGNVNGLKTDHAGWAVGDSLYLSETAGLLTNIKPVAPYYEVRVGRVIDVHATLGIINVRITPAYQLDNLSDVAVSGVVANQILKFDGVSWIPADSATTASAGGTNFFLTDSETAIEGLSRANPCIVTWTGHGLVDSGHQIKFEGITQAGWTALNSVSPAANLWHTITVVNENSFSIPVNTSGYAAAYVPASDPGIYCIGKLLQTPDGTILESIDAAQSTGNIEALLDVYASYLPLGRTTIEGGEWTFDTWGYASSATDTNVIVIRVFKRSAAGSETELFNVSTADLGTTITLSRISAIQPAFTILATDHLVVRYFAKSDRGSGAYRQIYLVHGGTTHYSLFKTPLAVAHNQLGGLNTTTYRHLPAAVADSDFAVGQASDGNWIKKTLAETQTILRSGLIAASISDSDTTHAPDGNSVFDALALKAPLTSPALVTPNLGTPSAGTLTNCTGLPLSGLSSSPITSVLTGYTSGAGTVASTDSVLQAIQKLNGNFEAGNLAYGVKWNTANSSPTLTKGIVVGGGVWIGTAYTSFPIQEQMKRCVLNATKAKVYDLDPTDSINKINVAPTITGTATSTTANKLVASAETFSTKGVVAGQWVKNVTTSKRTMITAVDSETALSVNDDIFVSGNAYSVGTANPKVDGAIFTEVPAFHYVWVEDGTNTYIIISQSPFVFRKPSAGTLVESVVHPWFNEGGVYSTKKYFSAFESIWYDTSASAYLSHDGATICAADDKAVSLPGYTPLTCQYRGTTSPNYRTLHTNFGANFHSHGFYGYEAIWILMTTEFASLNGQTYLPGYTAASGWSYSYCIKTGRTMGLGNASGSIVVDLAGLDSVLSGILTAGLYVANSYRGIENIYGHVWKWIDGINFNWIATGGKTWLSNNPAQWAEDTATNYEDTGYQLPLSDGYISALFPGRLLPKLVAGDSATYLCDYFYQPGASAGWRGLFSGGYLSYGVYAGPASLYAPHSGSGYRAASIGGRSAA